MVRRFLCLGAMLLLLLLGVPACSGEAKTKDKRETMPDPEGGAKPNPPGKPPQGG